MFKRVATSTAERYYNADHNTSGNDSASYPSYYDSLQMKRDRKKSLFNTVSIEFIDAISEINERVTKSDY